MPLLGTHFVGEYGYQFRPRPPETADIGDATEAFASILEHHARMLRHGVSREDTAITLLPIVRLATGRT